MLSLWTRRKVFDFAIIREQEYSCIFLKNDTVENEDKFYLIFSSLSYYVILCFAFFYDIQSFLSIVIVWLKSLLWVLAT